jgi:hypothetical protein
MPSDARTSHALDALAEHRARYRSAVAAAHDQMAGYLAAHRARTHGRAQTAAKELGRFAAGRIDAERFGALFTESHALTADTTERVERLIGVLAALLAEGDSLFVCEVAPGGDVREAVDRAIAQAGRVFGAVLAFQALKTATYRPERHDAGVLAFPFAQWNRSERLLSLPLVVEMDGADLRADAFSDYLDGRVAIVIVVRGACAPAPLVRLVTPGMLVVQTSDVAELRLLKDHDGPAIAALVPTEAARFVHDPRAGHTLHARLRVTATPSEPLRYPSGVRSAWQQREELAQLGELAQLTQLQSMATPTTSNVATGATAAVSAPLPGARSEHDIDRLTTWLLTEAGLGVADAAAGGKQ